MALIPFARYFEQMTSTSLRFIKRKGFFSQWSSDGLIGQGGRSLQSYPIGESFDSVNFNGDGIPVLAPFSSRGPIEVHIVRDS